MYYQDQASQALFGLQGAARRLMNQGVDANIFNNFQAGLPQQTAANVSLANEQIGQVARQGGMASGHRAALTRQATSEETAKLAESRLSGFREFMDLMARVKQMNTVAAGNMEQTYANAVLGREQNYMQNALAQRQLKLQEDAFAWQKQNAQDEMLNNLLGSLGGSIAKGASAMAGAWM